MDTTFRDEVLAGLARAQKTLSPKWLYDDRGCVLFEDITSLDAYYPTRTEAAIFDAALPEVGERLPGAAVAEFGSGASVKSVRLIEAVDPVLYVPIDIAEDFMSEAAESLRAKFPKLEVLPVAADFTEPAALPEAFLGAEPRLGFFPGSTIGNFDAGGAEAFLRRSRETLGPGAFFLVSADLVKSEDVLVRAYDDEEGVTAAFNLNLLTRMNRELAAGFDPQHFRHEARWNGDASRIEMHLVSALPQTVTVAGERFDFAEGESIHTENSHKYTQDGFAALADRAGWRTERIWTDERDWFGVFLLRS
ncbi:L-histidine N(alpha)-methyltransferase [Parvularcula dongshanensis]|uniref:Dimethylhistidine N-methyltransferase n=1 Tax=Parvularcula dongshanensis TaxID=1173995 RepID=A0A840I3T0_9PROT|nr:L-histidine N(alpha)-methyltransferase [Parvularcula dongshanensis]MBB4658864.1 dimethylhistidine N-methyltransferase [Parvularcula dongshanensis]